jgi:hypothetical protein
MTTATIAVPFFSYFSNLARATDNLVGAALLIKPSVFAECFGQAIAISRVAGEEGTKLSPGQLQELRKMMGLGGVAD